MPDRTLRTAAHWSGAPDSPIVYALSIALVVAAVGLRYLLDPWMGDTLPLVTLFGAIAAAVWLGGYRPAMPASAPWAISPATTCSSNLAAMSTLPMSRSIGLVAYLCTGALVIGLGEVSRLAQTRASEQRELLRITFTSIGDAVISTDANGNANFLNAVAQELTGWTDEEAHGKPLDVVFRIVHEDTRQPVENPATRALKEGVIVGLANHTVLIARDGTERPIDDSAAPIREEGQIVGSVLVFRDISERRRLEKENAAATAAARLLASIVESSHDAIISKSLDGIIQSWNAAAERLFGFTAEQAVGRHISLVIPPDRTAEEDRIIATLKAGQRVEHFDTVRLRGDGQPVLVSLTISPVKDEAGRVFGASKIVRDITGQRQAEERERRLLAEAAAANAKFRAFFDQGAAVRRCHGVGRHTPRSQPTEPGGVRLHEGRGHRQEVLGLRRGGTVRRN